MYRLFFNLAQCFSFLGVIIALVKDIIGTDVLFILATIIGSLIVLFIFLMIFTYENDDNNSNSATKIKKHY
ncbi:MAG: hypothetical protein IJT14_04150 [Rickettsiales bacterium]|nr:hypothetical protein [Rickettsiales bacterium]